MEGEKKAVLGGGNSRCRGEELRGELLWWVAVKGMVFSSAVVLMASLLPLVGLIPQASVFSLLKECNKSSYSIDRGGLSKVIRVNAKLTMYSSWAHSKCLINIRCYYCYYCHELL